MLADIYGRIANYYSLNSLGRQVPCSHTIYTQFNSIAPKLVPLSDATMLLSMFATSIRLFPDSDLFMVPLPSTNPPFAFLFCPEDEIVVC